MSRPVRVRFAPSPTGDLHLGGARTALVNVLFARRSSGRFVLRIEDTDAGRNVEGAASRLEEQLVWLGLGPDESPLRGGDFGPYVQSARKDRHAAALAVLERSGRSYRCFCAAGARSESGCPAGCSQIDSNEVTDRVARGVPHAFRFELEPGDRTIRDMLRGDVSFEGAPAPDPVVVRADGRPTYLFACAVDDAEMRISHVIRGDDHLPNAWKQAQMQRALGYEPPVWVHLPLILGPDRSPLSKRHGESSIGSLRSQGYLPEAIVFALGHLGMTPEQVEPGADPCTVLARTFALETLSSAAAVHDQARLDHLNASWLRALDSAALAARARSLPGRVAVDDPPEPSWWAALLEICCESQVTLVAGVALADLLLAHSGSELELAGDEKKALAGWLDAWPVEGLAGADESRFRELGQLVRKETGARGRVLFHPLRLALTGSEEGPMLSRLAPILDQAALEGGSRFEVQSCRQRIQRAAAREMPAR